MSTEDSISTVSSPEDTDEEQEKPLVRETTIAVFEEDLSDQLINRIKSITTLIDLHHDDWSLKTDEAIQEFLINRNETILTIFYDEDKLVAVCGFPAFELPDLMYFVKSSTDSDIKLENFNRIVWFGSIKNLAEATLLTILEQLYAPAYFNIKDWPDSVKQEFLSSLWQTISSLCRVRYKVAGLSVICVPPTALRLTPNSASKNEQFVKMLESIVSEWINDILEALRDLDETSPQYLLVPLDVLSFWRYRYDNLRGFTFQTSNKHCKHIIAILSIVQSNCVTNFHSVINDVKDALKIAESNIKYLQVIEEPCLALEEVLIPMDILQYIPRLLHSFKIIKQHSPYYNSIEKMSQLCRALSNQVIISCTKLVDLSIIFEGRTRSGMKIFRECIKCCLAYKSIYDKIKIVHGTTSEEQWNLDLKIILNSVDTFVERCQEMVELCETMLIYGRKLHNRQESPMIPALNRHYDLSVIAVILDETKDVPKPTFGFTRGLEFEKICDKIEDLFHENFSKVERMQDCILDVQSSDWYREMNRFRSEMRKIDTIAENLILESFHMVKNVEEGLTTLQSLYEYSKRPSLFSLIEKKTAVVYKMFWDELQFAKSNLLSDKNAYPSTMPRYAGRAWLTLVKKTRLKSLHNMFQEKLWLAPVTIAREVEVLYCDVMTIIDETICHHYKKWSKTVEANVAVRLKRSLITQCLQKPGLIEVNIDRKLLSDLDEAALWSDMGFALPKNEISQLLSRRDEFVLLFRNVEAVVMSYNRIIASLSDSERVLFRELIRSKEKHISICWKKLSWASESANGQVQNCTDQLKELQGFIDNYKKFNMKIVNICGRICTAHMVDIELRLYSLSDLKKAVDDHRYKAMNRLIKNYNIIFRYLIRIFEGFKHHWQMTVPHFMEYVNKIDMVLIEALRLCVKNSLQRILNYLKGDLIKGPTPFIILTLTLTQSNDIDFSPSLPDLVSFLRNIFYHHLLIIKLMPRLATKFSPGGKTPSLGLEPYAAHIARDRESTRIQVQIENQIAGLVAELKVHASKWVPLCDIWELDRDAFIVAYRADNPSAEVFEEDIAKHASLIEKVEAIDDVTCVRFVHLDLSCLKRTVIGHCTEWKSRLLELLIEMTVHSMDRVLNYAKRNTASMTKKPRTAAEVLSSIKRHKQLVSELDVMELRRVAIEENLRVYRVFAKGISDSVLDKKAALEVAWKDYEEILKEIDGVLADSVSQTSHKPFFEKCASREKDPQEYLEDILRDESLVGDWSVDEAMKYLNDVLSQLQRIYRETDKAA